MRSRITQIISVASLGAIVALPIKADDESHEARSSQKQSTSYKSVNEGTTALQGRIQSVRDASGFSDSGAASARTFKRITLQNGKTAFVDLGSERKARQMSLTQGDHVEIRGNYRNIDGRQVLVAEDVRVNGAWLATGAAQDADPRTRDAASSKYDTESDQHRLSGTVIGTKQLALRSGQGSSSQRQHTIARLELNDGKIIPVALGPKDRVDQLNVRKGQRLNVQAVPGTIDGKSILFAEKISAGDQTVRLQHSGYPTFRTASSAGRQQAKTVRGTIDGFKHVNLRSSARDRQQHSLVKVKMQDGRSQVVALGPKRDLDSLNLQKGKQITITGQQGMVDGRQVLFAQQIRVGEQSHRINWPNQESNQRTFQVRGTVEGYQVITMSSGNRQQALLNLRLADGRSILVDAGPNYTPGELKLDQLTLKDQVIISGQKKVVQGREVYVADNIEFRSQEQSRVRGSQGSADQQSQQQEGSEKSKSHSEQQHDHEEEGNEQ